MDLGSKDSDIADQRGGCFLESVIEIANLTLRMRKFM